jgi:uncharacterized protein (DUF983 family)
MPKKRKSSARTLALTIILGVFISIMVISLTNLTIDYAYERPLYENFCNNSVYSGPYDSQIVKSAGVCVCNYTQEIRDQEAACNLKRGMPVYDYFDNGCAKSVKDCDMCQKNYDDIMKQYNHNLFFILAIIGFIMIAVGLFLNPLLLQIILLPAGAWLVIQGSVSNFDEKLSVIIAFALLIIAAVYLAMKKLMR